MSSKASRLVAGERVPPFQAQALSGDLLTLPGPGFTHLQFRRFAGCPVCNWHLRGFALAHERLREAGVKTVAFFHSSAAAMRPYQGQLPFPCVPDPERHFYRQFRVERSLTAVAHPRVMWAAAQGLLRAPSNPFVGGSEQRGLPADFLLNAEGVLLAVHYGAHADDQWSVDQVIALSQSVG